MKHFTITICIFDSLTPVRLFILYFHLDAGALMYLNLLIIEITDVDTQVGDTLSTVVSIQRLIIKTSNYCILWICSVIKYAG